MDEELQKELDPYDALTALIGQDPEIEALQTRRDAIAQQRSAIADQAIKGVDITPAQAFAQLLAAAPAALLGGAIAGKRGLGAGLTAGGQAVEGSMARLEKKNERQQKGLALKDEALKDQSKEISDQLQKRTEFGQDIVKNKQKAGLDEDKEYNIAKRTEAIKIRIAAAGSSKITVNGALKGTLLEPEVVDAALKRSGLPKEQRDQIAKGMIEKGVTYNDLPAIGLAAKELAAGKFGESPVIKPIEGTAPTDDQIKASTEVAQFIAPLFENIRDMKTIFSDPNFDQLNIAGPKAQQLRQLLSENDLLIAEITKRGANLTGPELERIRGMRGIVSAAEGVKSFTGAAAQKLLKYQPADALNNFEKTMKRRATSFLSANNFQPRYENPEIHQYFSDNLEKMQGRKAQRTSAEWAGKGYSPAQIENLKKDGFVSDGAE